MKKFIDYCSETKKELPVYDSKNESSLRRSGIMHWAYPDGYIRGHYPAGYFMPTAADALQKMGPKVDDNKVDHGKMAWKNHEKTKA
jgi:hypothetical protein